MSVQLVFIQDFQTCAKESAIHLEERREAIQSIFRNNSDITDGLVQFKVGVKIFTEEQSVLLLVSFRVCRMGCQNWNGRLAN